MNFLGHFLTADHHQVSKLGNILPDICKPIVWRNLPDHFITGCKMHLATDKLVDQHPSFRRLKHRISDERRRFAGIILDVALDHYLAKHWHEWHHQPLEQFARECYAELQRDMTVLPPGQQHVLNRMIQFNWLVGYRDISGIAKAYQGLAQRFRYQNPMFGSEQEVVPIVENQKPELAAIVQSVLEDLNRAEN